MTPEPPGDVVELYRARGLPEAHAIRALLEAMGVSVRIENEFLQGALGDLPLGWSTAPRILVPQADEAAARATLDEFLRQTGPSEDHCLACRAPMGDEAVCPECGWSYERDPIETAEPEAADEPPSPDDRAPEPAAVPPHLSPAPPGAGGWGEVAAVLAVGVIPNLAGALVSLHSPAPPLPYWLGACQLTVLSACSSFVVLYLIHRGGEPWSRFGLDMPRFSDVPLGMALVVLWLVLLYLRAAVRPWSDTSTGYNFVTPRSSAEYGLMVIQNGVAAFSEELIVRAYLITRLAGLLGSPTRAVVLAAVAFASYHVYQGLPPLVDVFLFGLVFGIAYLALGRIWPLVIGHALFNIMLDLTSA
jgi:membrane protease YdiL (CAAX protease family)